MYDVQTLIRYNITRAVFCRRIVIFLLKKHGRDSIIQIRHDTPTKGRYTYLVELRLIIEIIIDTRQRSLTCD